MNEKLLEFFYDDKIAIHVETQEEYDDFMEYLESDTNLMWQASGKPTRVNNWSTNKEGTLLYCEEGKMSYGSVFYNATNDVRNYPVLKYKDLINNPFDIKSIRQNLKPNVTEVEFEDGDIVSVKRKNNTTSCLYTAVSAALAKKVYGSNSAFKKQLDKKLKANPQYKVGDYTNLGKVLSITETNKGYYYVLERVEKVFLEHESQLTKELPF